MAAADKVCIAGGKSSQGLEKFNNEIFFIQVYKKNQWYERDLDLKSVLEQKHDNGITCTAII